MESSNPLLQEAFPVSKSLHNNSVSTCFSFYGNLCKLINVESDNPSDVFVLQSFLFKEFFHLASSVHSSVNDNYVFIDFVMSVGLVLTVCLSACLSTCLFLLTECDVIVKIVNTSF